MAAAPRPRSRRSSRAITACATTKPGGEAFAGELLLAELNCTACHKPSDDAGAQRIAPKGAPDLSTIGARATPQRSAPTSPILTA